jgi:hypothetical protein
MSLELFARQSLAQFALIYAEIYNAERAIPPEELEAVMWGRMCAKDVHVTKLGFKIPYDNIRRAKVTLPYMPDDINYTGCACIKKNGGLYTPCCAKVPEDSDFCKSCSVDKEGEEKVHEFGDLDDRAENIENRRFAPITFGEWMRAKKTTLPEVYKKLAEAGIQLEIPSRELVCRELPKRQRKGRPSKDSESASDEDSEPKAKKAPNAKKSPKSSPKASPAASESESDSELPTPPLPPIKAPKAKKASSDEDEPAAPKGKKATKAKSDDDEPKAPKAKKPKAEAKSDDDEPKAKKATKAKKTASSDEDEPKAPKAKKPKAKAEEKHEPVEPEVGREEGEVEEPEEEECEVDGRDYMLRNQKYICDREDGTVLGTIVKGKVTWLSEQR